MLRRWLALPLLLVAADAAVAGTVYYSQPGTQACNPSCWTSHYGAGSGFRAYDDFTLTTTATITSLSWQGIYIPQTAAATAPAPDTTTWQIGFFADNGNFPGTSVFSVSIPAVNVATTLIGSGTFGGSPVNLYSFSATLGPAFTAAANTKYWFSPLSLAPSFDPFFSWSPSTAVYDGLTAQTDTNGNQYDRSDDRAFSLANAVPEPTSWALLIAGFAATGVAARRRRTVVA